MKILLLLALPFFKSAPQDSSGMRITTLPESKMVATFTADTRANRLSFQRNFDEISYTASMGGIFPILNFNKGKFNSQLSVAGSTYLTLARQNGAGSVKNVDFFGDILLDIQLSKLSVLRLGTGHSSQHLSDDAIIAGAPFKNYAKDYHQVLYILMLKKWGLQAYGGLHYNYNFKTQGDISGKAMVQLGFEQCPFAKRNYLRNLYYGCDLKLREEHNYATTFNFQFGYKMVNQNGKALRIAIDYTEGIDERGYYQPTNRNFAHMGIYFDF
ncbi:MAG: DUF1207 domain-containing protein [Bacteroidia bacterium]|nr:DUF1207 domain-containing protein [Bacteroidia bacterium]